MDKLRRLTWLLLFMPAFISCEEDVDNEVLGEVNYTIVNLSNHKCEIEAIPFNGDGSAVESEILVGDSVAFHTNGNGGAGSSYELFSDKHVYLLFDDTLRYDCDINVGHEMIASDRNYQIEEVSEYPEYHYEYRYVITEEDYEYAKAHPCTGK